MQTPFVARVEIGDSYLHPATPKFLEQRRFVAISPGEDHWIKLPSLMVEGQAMRALNTPVPPGLRNENSFDA